MPEVDLTGAVIVTDGDREATFAGWIQDHRGIVVKVARSFASTPEDVDDLIQEILLRIWGSVATFRAEAKVSTWIYRVAFNRAMTWQRSEKRRGDRQVPLIAVPDLAGRESTEAGHRLNELFAQIRALPEVDRTLVLLSLDGFSYREMSETVDMSETNVGARLSRAKAKLHQNLMEDHHA